ncbi:hypothetical protein MKJ01_09205 [Chryseobacterium sp. SSA4.19]|uniref:hypothetical protein n=1 Tax=Chryseobacterium sp. SSA4.19 TaxID=2919915 RepID=UPI001F4EE965|nr:hypothetical protein [Chryseobacterium sp. SSA4.19]MCJ8153932.1 hypothetical protein [Chryseobacterium sp. SSA4.19]
MKLFFPALFLCSALLSGQKAIPSDFKKIPEILDNPELLYPFIIPDKKYQYWSVLRNNPDPDEAVIYESQMPEYMTINDPAPEKGFFQKCLGEDCFTYLIACKNGQSEYFSDEKQLRTFIGTVDNLPEAVLIANTYGYTVDSTNRLSSSYIIEEKYIVLYLSKPKGCPKTKESFLIKIYKKTGALASTSNGIYFKSKDCK